jgi:hypothetical protein
VTSENFATQAILSVIIVPDMTLQMVMDVYTLMEHRFDFTNFNTWKTNVLTDAGNKVVVGRITDATGIPSPF